MTGIEKYFTKVVLSQGKGLESPNEGSICIVNLHVSQGELNFLHEEQNVTWLLGQDSGYTSEILNDCIEDMHAGEVCKITLHPCDELQNHLESFKTLENRAVVYKVELVSFQKAKERWESTFLERCQYGKEQKEKGTRYYKVGLWLFAARHYSKAIKSLILARLQCPRNASESKGLDLLQTQCYSNLAICQLKLKRYEHVKENCTKVLNFDSSNIKALFRRAKACIALDDLAQAEIDLKKALEFEPRNQEVLELKRSLEEKVNKQGNATSNVTSKMFQN